MTKKEDIAELVAPDPFVEHANRYASWVEKNLRWVVAVMVGGLGLVGLVMFVQQGSTRSASSVTSELTKAVTAYSEATDVRKTITSTQPEKVKAELEKAIPAFAEIEKKQPGSGAGKLAGLYEADLERRLGHHDKAEALYTAYAQHARPDDPLLFLAYEGAGYAAEEQGKYDEALASFQKLIDMPGKFYKDFAQKHKARVLELKGDKAGALAAYKAIVAMPDSKLKEFAEGRIAAIE
jgi:predicted negative regulator of RcsB-dependent stress response